MTRRAGVVRVCFVCLGNICRSPTAEAVFRMLVGRAGLEREIEIDSAGTGAWHVGHAPDKRSVDVARRRGIVVDGRARQFAPGDFERFDYVLAMDRSNYDDLTALAPRGLAERKLRLLRSFDPASPAGASVPDPYYTTDGFDEVIDLAVAACQGLLDHICAEHEFLR